jgi:hypothetical protein
VEGRCAEVVLTIRVDGEVTTEEAVLIEVDEPIASRAESRAVAPARRLHALQSRSRRAVLA